MALGDAYASLSALKKRLGIGDADTVDDAALTDALDVASRGVESCTNRQFNDAGAASARVFKPGRAGITHVDDFSTTVGLVVATDGDGDGVFETTWAASDFEVEPLNGVVNGVPGWPFWRLRLAGQYCRPYRFQVTARWGWAAIPSPVQEATLILAEDIFKTKDAPFGTGGYGEYGRIKARENPNVWLRICPYVRDAVLVA